MDGLCARTGKTSRVLLYAEQRELVRQDGTAQLRKRTREIQEGGKAHSLSREEILIGRRIVERWGA